MKRIKNGRHIGKGYLYRGYEIVCHGYYPPDKCIWWQAVDIETGCADFHNTTKKALKIEIDDALDNQK